MDVVSDSPVTDFLFQKHMKSMAAQRPKDQRQSSRNPHSSASSQQQHQAADAPRHKSQSPQSRGKTPGAPSTPPPRFPSAKVMFQRYVFLDKLGAGSYGTVWKCRDRREDRLVACKQMHKKRTPGGAGASGAANRLEPASLVTLLREVDCLEAAQGHEGVLRLEGVYESELYLYIVTELCEGGDLFDFIRDEGPLDEADARQIFRDVVEAVRHCHVSGVIHRDIKPENILLHICPETGRIIAKLADFGLAKRLFEGERTKGWVGSEPYEAPEVMSGGLYGYSADVFSLGVVLFGMMSGNWPTFSEGRVFEAEDNFCWKGWKGVSREVKDLLTKVMSAYSSRRPSTTQILSHPWLVGGISEEFSAGATTATGTGVGAGEGAEACSRGWTSKLLASLEPLALSRTQSGHEDGSCAQPGAFSGDEAVWVAPESPSAYTLPSPCYSEISSTWFRSVGSSRRSSFNC